MRLFLSSLFVTCAVLNPLLAFASAPLSDAELRGVIESGTTWLENAQESNGHFRYEYLPYQGTYREDDNIVRQAGAFFQLGEIERMDDTNAYNLEVSLRQSAAYFASLSVSGEFNGRKFKCIKEKEYPSCKLGATALAAIGLSDFLAAYPSYEKKYRSLLADYNSYLLAMKKSGAGFRYYYNPKTKNQKEQESSFSNGEAFFALVRAYERKPSKEVRAVIDDTFTYLDTRAPFDSALYLWAMAGVRDLAAIDPKPAYTSYVYRYTKWRLADNARYVYSTRNRCPYIEGLASAESVLKDTQPIPEVRATIDAMLRETTALQVGKNTLYRYITDSSGGRLAKLVDRERAWGGFLTGHASADLTQRIDFTQHCLSAYAQTLVDIRGGTF